MENLAREYGSVYQYATPNKCTHGIRQWAGVNPTPYIVSNLNQHIPNAETDLGSEEDTQPLDNYYPGGVPYPSYDKLEFFSGSYLVNMIINLIIICLFVIFVLYLFKGKDFKLFHKIKDIFKK